MDLALFDFDGTLTTRETFADVLAACTPRWRWVLGRIVLAPCVLAHRGGVLSAHGLRTMATGVAFAGRNAADVQAAMRAAALRLLPALECASMRTHLQRHRARGDRIVVVSGNYEWWLRAWCDAQGLECLASQLEVRRTRLTGRYRGAQCVGPAKAQRVRAHLDLSAYAQVHAYGDTREDAALLDLAHVRLFRGQPVDCAA